MNNFNLYLISILIMFLDEVITFIGLYFNLAEELNPLYPLTSILKLVYVVGIYFILKSDKIHTKTITMGLLSVIILYVVVLLNNILVIL